MGGAHYLNVRVKVVVLSLGGDRGYRVPAGLLLWCRTIGLVLRARILLFAALFLPLLRHGVNASGQFFAIATNGSAVPMLVGNPTAFLRRRSLRWKVRYTRREEQWRYTRLRTLRMMSDESFGSFMNVLAKCNRYMPQSQ